MHSPHLAIRKALTALLVALSLHGVAGAQEKSNSSVPFGKGDNTVAIGIGLGLNYNYLNGASGSPAFVATFDHGIVENVGPGTIGIGGIFGYKTARYEYRWGNYDARWSNAIIAARGTYHLTLLSDKLPNLDLYGGVMLGFRIWSYDNDYYDNDPFYNDYDASGVSLTSGMFVGAKYNFTPSFGAWSELGYDVSFLKLGVHFNF